MLLSSINRTANIWCFSDCLFSKYRSFCRSSNAEFDHDLTTQPTTAVNNQYFGHEVDSGSPIAMQLNCECSALNCGFHSAASLSSGACGEFWTGSEQYDVLDYFACEPDYAYPLLFDEWGWPITFYDFVKPGFAKQVRMQEVSDFIKFI